MRLLDCGSIGKVSGQTVMDDGQRLYFFNHSGHYHGSLDALEEDDVRDLIALASALLEAHSTSDRVPARSGEGLRAVPTGPRSLGDEGTANPRHPAPSADLPPRS